MLTFTCNAFSHWTLTTEDPFYSCAVQLPLLLLLKHAVACLRGKGLEC